MPVGKAGSLEDAFWGVAGYFPLDPPPPSWGDEALKEEVARLFRAGRAWMAPPIRTELLVGARDAGAFKKLAELPDGLPEVPLNALVWREAAWFGF